MTSDTTGKFNKVFVKGKRVAQDASGTGHLFEI
jgi:hypothetical protein